MSSNVEERVVEMRFDNQQFEKNAKTTIKTLDALDKSLDLKGATDGFKDLEKAAKGVDISSLERAAEAVSNKFSLFGVIGDQAIRRVTDSLINLSRKWVMALPDYYIDQARVGWSKYEAKTNAVQVIMHATGNSIEEVNDSLDKLTWYTDETSYKFDQMVDAISKFTGAGLDLKTAEQAAEGIANWAATAGVGADKAGMAFYNLSQAMSSGSLRAQDWKSIENLNMNTVEFEQTAIDVAEAMIKDGRASKEMAAAFKKANPQVQGFRDTLQTGWLDKDVMTEVFKVYSDRTTEFGLAAFKAAQEAKTFKDAVDAAKEATATGWSNIFEQLFGNYEEAKVFWTEVANEMIDAFAGPVVALSELLTEWHGQGGYVDFINSIRNAWASVKSIGEAVKDTFREIFPALGVDKLLNITKGLENLTGRWKNFTTKIDIDSLKLLPKELRILEKSQVGLTDYYEKLAEAEAHNKQVDQNLSNLKDTLRGLFSILNIVKSLSSALFKMVLPFTRLLVPIAQIIGTITGALGRMSSTIVDAILQSEWFNGILSFLEGIAEKAASGIAWLADKVAKFMDNLMKVPLVESFVGIITDLFDTIKELAGPYIEKIGNSFSYFFGLVKDFINSNFESFLSDAANVFKNLAGSIVLVAESVWEYLQPAFGAIAVYAEKAWNLIKRFGGMIYNWWTETVIPTGVFQYLVSVIGTVRDKVKELSKSLYEHIQNGGIPGAIDWIRKKFQDLWWTIRHFNIAKVLGDAFSLAKIGGIMAFALSIYKASRLISSAVKFLKSFPKAIRSFTKGLMIQRFATSILMVAGALFILSKVEEGKLWSLAGVLGALAGGLVVFTLALSAIGGFLAKKDLFNKGSMAKSIAGMIAISVSLLLLAVTLKKISDIEPERLWPSVWAMIAIMGAIAAAAAVLSIGGATVTSVGIGLLALAGAIWLLILAFERIKGYLPELEFTKDQLYEMGFLFVGLSAGLIGIALALKGFSKGTWQIALMVLSIGAALFLISEAVSKIIKLSGTELGKAAGVLIGLVAALISVGLAAKMFPSGDAKNILAIAAVVAALGASVFLISKALKVLADIDSSVVAAGLGRLAIIFGMMIPILLVCRKIQGGFGAVIGVAVLLVVVVAVLKFLSEQDFGKMMSAAILLSAVMLTLGFTLTFASMGSLGKAGPILAMAGVIAALVGALYVLTLIDSNKLSSAALALSGTLIAIAPAMAVIGLAFKGSNWAAILALAGVLLVLAHGIAAIGELPIPNMLSATIALGTLLYVLAGTLTKFTKASIAMNPKAALSLFLTIAAVLAPLVGALWALSKIASMDMGAFISAAVALAVLIPELAFVAAVISKIKVPGVKSSLKLALLITMVLLPICLALGIMTAVVKNPDEMVTIANAISKVMLAILPMVAVVAILGTVLPGGAALSGIASLGQILSGVLIIFGLLGYIVGELDAGVYDKIISGLDKMVVIFSYAGRIFGAVLGGFIAEIGNIVTDAMPGWGENIGAFLTNLAPGIEKISGIQVDESSAEGLKHLAVAILALTAADVIDGLTSWITGGVDFGEFATAIEKMGPALAKFNESTQGINPETIGPAADAIAKMAEVASTLEKDGGLWQDVVGHTKKLDEFAQELANSIKDDGGFIAFAKGAEVLNQHRTAITNSATAIGDIINVANKLQRVGGWIDTVAGKVQTLDEFATNLAQAVYTDNGEPAGFLKFAEAAPELSKHKGEFSDIATVLGELVDVANKLKPLSTSYGWGFYSEYMQGLGDFMQQFTDVTEEVSDPSKSRGYQTMVVKKGIGTIMNEFSEAVKDVDTDKLTDVIPILDGLIKAGEGVEAKTAEVTALWGAISWKSETTSGIESLLGGLTAAAPALVAFSQAIGTDTGLDLTKLSNFTNVLQRLANVEKTLDNVTMFNLTGFANSFYTVADKFAEAGLLLQGVNTERIDGIVTMVEDMYTRITELGDKSVEEMETGMVLSAALHAWQNASLVRNSFASALETEGSTSRFETIGANFVQGIINGVERRAPLLVSTGIRTAREFIRAVTGVFQEASPSKVGVKIGKYFDEGLILGVQEKSDEFAETGANIANTFIDSVSDAFHYVDQILSGELSPDLTIRPVLDLTNIQSGANTIDSLFAQRQAIMAEVDASSTSMKDEVAELLTVGWQILGEIQNGRDIYLDGRVLAGSMNRRLGRMEGIV